MKRIFWILDLDHYSYVADQLVDYTDFAICSADAAVCWDLNEREIPHYNLWNFITLEDQLQVAQEALVLSDTWLDKLNLCYNDVKLDYLCRKKLLYTFRDALLARRIAYKFLDQVSIYSPILLFPQRTSHPHIDVLEAVLRWATVSKNITVESLRMSISAPPSLSYVYFAKQIYRSLEALIRSMKISSILAHQDEPVAHTVAFFGAGTDLINQSHPARTLYKTSPFRVIQVNISTSEPKASAYSRSQETKRNYTYLRLPLYKDPREYVRYILYGKNAWRQLQNLAGAHIDRYPEVFQNRWLSAVLRSFFLRELPITMGLLETSGDFMENYKPDLVVLNNDSGSRARAVIEAARKRGIPSVLSMHSGVNDLHFRYPYADQVFVWGDIHQRQLAELGFPSDRIHITGNPNYDYLVDLQKNAASIRSEIRQKLGVLDDVISFLLVSAKSPYLLTFVDIAQHLYDIKALAKAVQALSRANLFIKPHPRYDDISVYRSLAKRSDQITVVEDILLDHLLLACDVAVMVNYTTTGGIEALLLGKPLVWVNASVKYPPMFSMFDQGALIISERDQIAPTLQQLQDCPAYRKSITDLGQKYLPALVSHADGSATNTMITKIIQTMLSEQA